METLKKERKSLDRKIRKLSFELSFRVAEQFRRFPDKVSSEIMLYNGSPDILEQFRKSLKWFLGRRGYEVSVITGDKPRGYSIDVNAYLQLKGYSIIANVYSQSA